MKAIITASGVILLIVNTLQAQEKHSLSKRLDSLFSNLNPIAVPTIQNAPETSWNFGIGISYYLNTTQDTILQKNTRTSSLALSANYSLRNQLQTEIRWQIFSPNERMFYRGLASYADFVDKFWGIGNHTSEADISEFSFQRVQVQSSVLRGIAKNIFLGGNYQFSSFEDLEWFRKNENLRLSQLIGSNGNSVSGLGPIFIADFRDNPFSATRGFYVELSSIHYRSFLGSTHHFNEYFVDLRSYKKIFQKHVLAFQMLGNFMEGHVPFREKPRLGGAQIMRGYFNGRFIDNNMIAFQAEYRMPIYKRFASSFFVSSGQVAPTVAQFGWPHFKVAYGAGLRLLLNAKESIYARFDFAQTLDGNHGFYIRINDAF
ncbi:MAG: BamA/TamA family outer membrane protein [Runella sp.]